MSKFGCSCGHTIVDQTDFLPYKAHIREDEDTEKPIELLVDLLARYWDAHQQGQEAESAFIRQVERSRGKPESAAEYVVNHLAGKSVSYVLADLIAPFWNNYDRTIYECDDCGRLWVQMENGHFVAYLPETDERHVLWSRHHHHP